MLSDDITGGSPNIPGPLLRYQLDICMFPEVSIARELNYVVSELTTLQLHTPGYCGCFKHDSMNMSQFLKRRCIGSVSWQALQEELKLQQFYGSGNCNYQRRIHYSCEPGKVICSNDDNTMSFNKEKVS